MRTTAAFCLLFLLVGIWLPTSLLGKQETSPAKGVKPAQERVILRINRNVMVAGYLALDEDDVIAVRDQKGEVHSFPKSRVLQVVRLVEPQPNQTGMVVMIDGQVREGIILEDAFEHVLMEIQGIRAKLKRETVSHVLLQPTIDQRYAEYKAALRPGMYDAHLLLCRWLVEQGRYDAAHVELTALLAAADMPDARKLLNLVEAQLALRRKPEPTTKEDESEPSISGSSDADTKATDDSAASSNLLPADILTKADVNIIRVFEIDFDQPPKVTITPDTVKAIIEHYGTSKLVPASQTGRTAMYRAASSEPLEIVRLMFDLRARDLYSQIQVNSEPHSMNLFRQRVHDTWLMNNCATSRCHGGPDAGKLFLHRKNYKDERVRYTNFLILERLKLDPEWPLINYDRPEDSLIMQYGMSRDDANCRKPHPTVPGWKPAFNQVSPRMKHDTVEWIASMMQPRPEYPVVFEPSVAAGAQHEASGSSGTNGSPR